jgi:hypothetical protein
MRGGNMIIETSRNKSTQYFYDIESDQTFCIDFDLHELKCLTLHTDIIKLSDWFLDYKNPNSEEIALFHFEFLIDYSEILPYLPNNH